MGSLRCGTVALRQRGRADECACGGTVGDGGGDGERPATYFHWSWGVCRSPTTSRCLLQREVVGLRQTPHDQWKYVAGLFTSTSLSAE